MNAESTIQIFLNQRRMGLVVEEIERVMGDKKRYIETHGSTLIVTVYTRDVPLLIAALGSNIYG